MYPSSASTTIVTANLAAAQAFYEEHFDARAIFDCGWYVVLRLGGAGSPEVCLMEPQEGQAPFAGGVTLNLCFDDADAIFEKLTAAGIAPAIELEDHPWGDRGFGVVDPAGVMVYCYHPIPPAPEFAKFVLESSD